MRLEELTLEHETTFRDFVDRNRTGKNCQFEDSWAYILQATRNWPRIYMGDGNLVLFSKKDDGTIVVPNYFVSDDGVLTDLVRRFGQKVILKNVNLEDVERLRKLGFNEYEEGEQWSDDFLYDDQTFPQQVLDLVELIKLEGKNYAGLRRNLNYFRKTSEGIIVREYDPDRNKERIIQLTELQEERNPGTLEAHRVYFDIGSTEYLLPLVFEIEGVVVGFTLLDRISEQCVAYNALIYDADVLQLSYRITLESARVAVESGYKFFNLQGSETVSLDQWKRKFNPAISIHKTHLVYGSE